MQVFLGKNLNKFPNLVFNPLIKCFTYTLLSFCFQSSSSKNVQEENILYTLEDCRRQLQLLHRPGIKLGLHWPEAKHLTTTSQWRLTSSKCSEQASPHNSPQVGHSSSGGTRYYPLRSKFIEERKACCSEDQPQLGIIIFKSNFR